MTDHELFQQALDDLLHVSDGLECLETIDLLSARVAQPEPEPIAWLNKLSNGAWIADVLKCEGSEPSEPLYTAPPQPEPEPVGNTLTFMTRAIFNIVADHQEINGGYFIADGDVAAFVDRLAKVINSTFEPLKEKNND